MSKKSEGEVRAEILSRVRQLAEQRQTCPPFVGGESAIHYAGRVYGEEEMVMAVEAVLDFWLTAGRFTETFETNMAQYLGADEFLMVNSGSSANLLAVATLCSPQLGERGLRPGDEVVTVASAFPTTVAPLVQYGLIPVFVDVDLGGYNAIPERLAGAVGPKTRAIMLAHTLGNPWDAQVVLELSEEHDLWIVEDNCDALGSTFMGRKTGTFGHLSTFSFYPAHHITTGEGGGLATSDEKLARIARSLRDWGRDCYCAGGENNTCGRRFSQQLGGLPFGYDHKYVYSHIGYNLKATDIQAAIGCAQLDRIESFVERRKANHAYLAEALRGLEDRLVLPMATPGSDPSWFGFAITLRDAEPGGREALLAHLDRHRIETRNLFSGNLLLHPGYTEINHRVFGDLANTNRVTTDTFFLGVYPGLGEPQLSYVAESVHGHFAGR